MTEKDKPQFVIIAGPNGSGKSSTSKPLLKEGVFIIDLDQMAKALKTESPELEEMDANLRAILQVGRLVQEKIEKKESFAVETVLSTDKYHKDVDAAKEQGYEFQLVYIATRDPEINKERVQYRAENGGHDVPVEKIEARYYRSLDEMPKFYDKADHVVIVDNSDKAPTAQLFKENGQVTFINEKTEKWVIESLGENRMKEAIKSYLHSSAQEKDKGIER